MSATPLRLLLALLGPLVVAACESNDPSDHGPAAQLHVVSGDAQQATVATALSMPLVVRVTDVDGRPVPGVSVGFEVAATFGVLSAASGTSDEIGEVSVDVTLGQVAGTFHVTASIENLTSLDFSVQANPGAATQILAIQGNGQQATPGTAVPVAPVVEVRDEFGNPVPGVTVQLATSTGTVTPPSAVTGADGRVTIETWTLGPERGEQALVATVDGAGTATFGALAVATAPGIAIQVLNPGTSALVDDELAIRARVTSTFSIAMVTAVVGTSQVPLTFSAGQNEYVGTMSLVGAPRDQLTLVVSAQDVNGAVTDGVRQFIHDRQPTLTVVAPLSGSVALPGIAISAICEDDDPAGCTSLSVTNDGMPVTQSTSAIDGTFALNGSGPVWLTFRATDSRGQERSVLRRIFVEPPQRLQEVTGADGAVLDYRDERVLFIDSTATIPTPVIRDGQAETVMPSFVGEIQSGVVLPSGAIVLAWTSQHGYRWHILHNGASTIVPSAAVAPRRAGDFVVYGAAMLIRREATSGAEVSIAADVAEYDVAANGDVVYTSGGDIFRYRAGSSAPITADDPAVAINVAPRTDGELIVYAKRTGCCGSASHSIALFDGVDEIELAPTRPGNVASDLDYAVNSGWVAFTLPDGTGRLQVWTRSPTGTLRQVSFLGTNARISALGPDGTVIFQSLFERYRSTATQQADLIMSQNGTVAWQESRFVVLIGRMVLAIN